jgi:hypothetical protein
MFSLTRDLTRGPTKSILSPPFFGRTSSSDISVSQRPPQDKTTSDVDDNTALRLLPGRAVLRTGRFCVDD